MLHCFALKPPAPEQSESGQRSREKVNMSMIDYLFFLFFKKRNLSNALGTLGASSQFKTIFTLKAFQCCQIETVLILLSF